MTTAPKPLTIGGHQVEPMPNGYRCFDCGLNGDYYLFTVGVDGCPMRPASLDYLSVCPGGELCEGHVDTSTAEYRLWKESMSMPKEQVPHLTCDASLLGVRAAHQWLKFADRIGLKTSVWAQTAIADRVGAGGGHIADLQTTAGHFHIVVTCHGKLRAHQGRDLGCQDCAILIDKGEVKVTA